MNPPPPLKLSLQMPDGRHREVLARHRVARWIRSALQAPAEMTVRVVGEDEGRELNGGYRTKDYATNVLTFAYAQQPVVQADLVLCAPVVECEARAQGKTLQAHYAHLIVHGTLHAQGHDHERLREARRMEALETAILARLGIADPYAEPAAAAAPGPASAAPKTPASRTRPRP